MMTKNITSFLSRKNIVLISSPIRSMTTIQDDVLFQEVNNKGVITLNRPKALNALNLSMVSKLYPKLREWESNKVLVLVKGAGGKAFCAGGDVRAVTEAGIRGDKLGEEFFKTEYATNGLIGRYKIPYIALIDGIVMGGGVGLSVHGHYRIATERSMFAMPETQIGLFPDVGGSYFLPRLPGALGLYLALTGVRLKGPDVLRAGIATHYCDSKNLNKLEEELLNCGNRNNIDTVLEKFSNKNIPDFSLKPVLKRIDQCFSARTVEEIVKNLNRDKSQWANDSLKLLNKMSPTSLKVTLKQLELGKSMTLNECLIMEYRLAVSCMKHKDFFEGVRALLIDKDQNPKWNPPSLDKVSEELVEEHFSAAPGEELLKTKL